MRAPGEVGPVFLLHANGRGDDEFVARPGGRPSPTTSGPSQTLPHLHKNHIPGRMSPGIVDDLEIVEVQEQDGQLAGIRSEAFQVRESLSRAHRRLGKPLRASV